MNVIGQLMVLIFTWLTSTCAKYDIQGIDAPGIVFYLGPKEIYVLNSVLKPSPVHRKLSDGQKL